MHGTIDLKFINTNSVRIVFEVCLCVPNKSTGIGKSNKKIKDNFSFRLF
jgi:hypothetical protein